MKSSRGLLRLAATIQLLLLASHAAAMALNNHARQATTAPAWVTVDTHSRATTITPTVTSINGALTTISPPPANLTKTTAFVLSSGGASTTVTGSPPVATADGPESSGAFLVCHNQQGPFAPFCQPSDGLVLSARMAYYVTWDTSFFSAQPNTSVQIQGTFPTLNSSGSDGSSSAGDDSPHGFSGQVLPASQGFYVWEPAFELAPKELSSLDVQLVLAIFGTSGGGDDTDGSGLDIVTQHPGPTVHLTNSTLPGGFGIVGDDGSGSGDGTSKPSAAVIAVPVVIGLAIIALVGLCFWQWRRTGRVPVVGRLMGSSAGSVRRGRIVAPGGSGKGGGIQLTDRESWSPGRGGGVVGGGGGTTADGQGRNVFREEIQRQEWAG